MCWWRNDRWNRNQSSDCNCPNCTRVRSHATVCENDCSNDYCCCSPNKNKNWSTTIFDRTIHCSLMARGVPRGNRVCHWWSMKCCWHWPNSQDCCCPLNWPVNCPWSSRSIRNWWDRSGRRTWTSTCRIRSVLTMHWVLSGWRSKLSKWAVAVMVAMVEQALHSVHNCPPPFGCSRDSWPSFVRSIVASWTVSSGVHWFCGPFWSCPLAAWTSCSAWWSARLHFAYTNECCTVCNEQERRRRRQDKIGQLASLIVPFLSLFPHPHAPTYKQFLT